MSYTNDLKLSRTLTNIVQDESDGLDNGNASILEKVTPITSELLKFWFLQEYQDGRTFNFHEGQKAAILNTIYAHEVLKITSLRDLYQKICPMSLLESTASTFGNKQEYPKYCLKMATGTGKTWVFQALLLWQFLNARESPHDPRFSNNFLIIAPGLIVYERLIDAFLGKERNGQRDFSTSDLSRFQDLFIPDNYRDLIFNFVRSNVCIKEEIGIKTITVGFIGITNKHALKQEEEAIERSEDLIYPGLEKDSKKVAESILPLSPGISEGHELTILDKRFERNDILQYLSRISNLLVFNDEAHHIHEAKKNGEITEVEWQKSLNLISSSKNKRFIQIDFSATPYLQSNSGKAVRKNYFPHIICDFELKKAMALGLVKSLVLDTRKELGSLSNDQLNFNSDRDEEGNPTLSEGQRIMLRAGLEKLRILETDFSRLDSKRHPKMLIVCEDTSVTPLVEEFLVSEGHVPENILRIDSNKKYDVTETEWKNIRERLFNLDSHANPKIIISVLMLREGFDVNNICVIVPLRATQAPILLEQTIGRGLRLMWRDDEYEDSKRENRTLIASGREPSSLIDVLSIVEHPAFNKFYEELKQEGLVSFVDDEREVSSAGDMISVGLRNDYEAFDFEIPFIERERDEELYQEPIDITSLSPFDSFSMSQLKKLLPKGEKFHSVDLQAGTTFGDYSVHGGLMNATGYNDFLSRLVTRITTLLSTPLTKSTKVFANKSSFPYLQVNKAQLVEWIDIYIRIRLFSIQFDPLEDENWRLLMIGPVTDHINQVWARQLLKAEESTTIIDCVVSHRRLSEIEKLNMRSTYSIPVSKCIYERLRYPSKNGEFERSFIEVANRDAQVERFCKIDEHKHSFLKLRYINEEGMPSFYHPDFLVKIENRIFLVETKATGQGHHLNVKRKHTAALNWCNRINELPTHERMNAKWSYSLIEQNTFENWHLKGARLREILELAKVREPSPMQSVFA